jgi:hypothetical protein
VTTTLTAWAAGRRSRAALLTRRFLGAPDPGDEALARALAAEIRAAPPATLAAEAWRLIELMDLGPVPEDLADALIAVIEQSAAPALPLLLPTGTSIGDAESARIAGEALALRALTKARRQDDPRVRGRLDDLARRGPDLDGVTRRASALHGLAADAVHYPHAVARLVDELARAQRPDGGWGEAGVFHVAQALLSVERASATDALRRALPQLEGVRGTEGGYGSDERSWIAARWIRRVGG